VTSLLTHRYAPLAVGMGAILTIASVIVVRAPLPAGLAEGHARVPELARLSGCARCHTEHGIDPGCTECHDEIRAQLDARRGYHGFLAENEDGERCTRCHLDHFGSDFTVAGDFAWRDLDREGFDHPHLSAFSLVGAHDELDCEGCHSPELAPPVSTGEFPGLARETTFLGLTQECKACHEDPHAGGLSPECAECHDQEAFSPAPLFDHDEHFVLGCAHEEVDCALCHVIPTASATEEAKSLPFAEVRGNECLQCHESPHRTEMSPDCFDCHPKDACRWREGQAAMTASIHRETGFDLGRAHADVECEKCHPSELDYPERYPDPASPGYRRGEETCEGCHEDEHDGQFAGRYQGCRECHSKHAFIPTEFTIADHSVWPLEGSHIAVLCGGCHVVPLGSETRVYVGTRTECADCHQDPHFGQFAESAGKDCQRCHVAPLDWTAPGFDHDRDSRFPLDGDHVDVPCASCHPSIPLPDGTSFVQYRPLGRECQDCHERPDR